MKWPIALLITSSAAAQAVPRLPVEVVQRDAQIRSILQPGVRAMLDRFALDLRPGAPGNPPAVEFRKLAQARVEGQYARLSQPNVDALVLHILIAAEQQLGQDLRSELDEMNKIDKQKAKDRQQLAALKAEKGRLQAEVEQEYEKSTFQAPSGLTYLQFKSVCPVTYDSNGVVQINLLQHRLALLTGANKRNQKTYQPAEIKYRAIQTLISQVMQDSTRADEPAIRKLRG